ncbi:hypothetical protein F5050DRAFT_381100 [Lentinula boryana]|uniref:BTB domain-containing protein n=1 Tax=Lentinula boryana TaxID=40481 RepID=A0ABQ8Q8V1_9AGAR|nr:hypothetical protein F5050DRAFT_381100 [Lentinula boryana]
MASAPATIIIPNVPDPSKAGAPLFVGQKCQYHPSFRSAAADVVLCASDGVMYRMHSYTLRTSSGFFRTMFTLPQHSPQTDRKGLQPRDVSISTYVSSDVLTLFLMLISGLPINAPLHEWGHLSPFVSFSSPPRNDKASIQSCFDIIDRVLHLAEDWDAPGPLSYLRLGLRNPELAKRYPLKLFSIASHFGWDYERNWAAQHCLMIDFPHDLDLEIQHTMESMSSKDLLCLLKLRHRRKEEFEALLNDPDRFSVGNAEEVFCPQCHETLVDNGTWRVLKEAMIMELERRPLGDTIVGYDVDGIGGESSAGGLLTWPEADACFNAICKKKGCGCLTYDECTTLKQIQGCIDNLTWDL